MYNPFRMLIYGEQCECINTYMTHFEASNFLNSLIKEIMKQCRNMNEAKEKSELFSLYCLHLHLIQTYKISWYKRTNIDVIYETTDIKFYDFLSILYAIRKNKNVDNQLEHAKKQLMEQVEKSEGDEFILLKTNNNNSSSLLLKDLFKHMRYKINLSLKALIYGLKCKGKGYESRVTEHERYNDDNYTNAMKMTWKDRKEYSTWCKFRFSTHFNNSIKFIEQTTNYFDGNPDNSYYGQFNFFMKLSIPSEKILHGLKMASVTAVSNHTPSYMWNHPSKNKNEQYKSRSVIV